MKTDRAFLLRKMYRKLLPTTLVMIIIMGLNAIINSIFAGRLLGTRELAAIGLYSPVSNILSLSFAFVAGAQILSCQEIGKGNGKGASSLFSTCFVILLSLATVFGLLMFFCGSPIATALGAGKNRDLLVAFFKGRSFGIPGFLLYTLFMTSLPLNNRSNLTVISLIAMTVSNILGDYFFIVVLHSGIFGLGLSFSISSTIGTVIAACGFFQTARQKCAIHFYFHELCFNRLFEILKNGFTQISFNLSLALRSWVINVVLMNYFGTDAVAGVAVLNAVCCFVWAIPVGCSNAELILGSIFYGERNREAMKSLVKHVLYIMLLLSGITVIAVFAAAGWLSGIYFTPGGAVWRGTVIMLRIYILSLIPGALFMAFSAIYQVQSQILFVNIMTVVHNLLIAVLSLLLPLVMSLNGVWFSFQFGELICIAIIAVSVFKKAGHITFKLEDWMKFDPNFGIHPENVLSFFPTSMEDVMHISESISDFCKEKKVNNPRTVYLVSLSIEELVGNILSYGMDNQHKHCIDIRLFCEGDSITVHIKDDCRAFDPVSYLKQFSPDDITHNIGMRMVAGTAKEMTWQRILGINHLSLTV